MKNTNLKFVAEFTTNHMGNMNVLLRMVEEAKRAGANLIKMQKKDVKTFYTKEKLNSIYKSPYGKTYEDYRSIFEFNEEDYQRFDNKCKEVGIEWFSTVQDIKSLYEMLELNLNIYKVASCNSKNTELLQELSASIPSDKEIVISVAGRTLQEIEQTVEFFPNHKLFILHCVAEYPCKATNLRLGNINILKKEFESENIKIGYSGHEEGIYSSIAAADMDINMIERHFCLSRHSFVHHIECSLEPTEFSTMTNIIRQENELEKFYKPYLPPIAYESKFKMSVMEKEFLEKQTYGNTFLHNTDGSRFTN